MTEKQIFFKALRRAGPVGEHSRILREAGISSPSQCAHALEAEGIKVSRVEERLQGRRGARFTLRDVDLHGDPDDRPDFPRTEILGMEYEYLPKRPSPKNRPLGRGWQLLVFPYLMWARPLREENAPVVALADVERELAAAASLEDAVLAALAGAEAA